MPHAVVGQAAGGWAAHPCLARGRDAACLAQAPWCAERLACLLAGQPAGMCFAAGRDEARAGAVWVGQGPGVPHDLWQCPLRGWAAYARR